MKLNIIKKAVVISLLLFLSCVPKHAVVLKDGGVSIDPQIVYGVLPNGFQYILMENKLPENRVNVHLNVFAGSIHETDDEQGVAHYLEHMLFNGTEHFKPGELVDYFQRIGMDFGADANAHTSFFETVYDLSLPGGSPKDLDEAFLVMQDYAKGALLIPEEIDRERGIILAEKRERDSVSYRSYKKEFAFELPGSRFVNRWPIGIESVLKKLDRKTLKGFYDRWYRPDNLALVVVGDFDAKNAEKQITERFSKLKPRAYQINETFDTRWEPHQGIKTFYHYEPEAGKTSVTIETITWTPFEPETVEMIQRQYIDRIADTMVDNRLSRMISEQTAGFSQSGVYTGTYLRNITVSAVYAACAPEKWKVTLSQLENNLRQALDHGFTQQELDNTRAQFISMLETNARQAETRKTPKLAKQILSAINSKRLILSPQQQLDLLKPFILGLTVETVNQVFRENWSADHRLILVSGNAKIEPEELTPDQVVDNAYQSACGAAVSKYKDMECPPFPYLTLPEKTSLPDTENEFERLGIKTVRYQNNVQLNVKTTDFKKDEFLFKLSFGDGRLSIPADKPGLDRISEQVVNESGLGGIEMIALEQVLAGRKLGFSFNIKDNYIEFSGSADPEEVELVFQLIYHFLKDPGIREQALKLSKARYRQEFDGMVQKTEGLYQIKGERFFAGGDPRFGLPVPDVVDAYQIQDIKTWLIPQFSNSPVEVSIVGDIDYKDLRAQADKYLGALEKRSVPDSRQFASERISFPKGKKEAYTIETKIESGLVHVALLTDDFWDIQQTRRLSMLSRVISERLRKVIREELGAAYAPYAYNDPSIIFENYGILHIAATVKPGTQQFISDKIHGILSDIIKNKISEDETQLVLMPVINHIRDLRKTNSYWMHSVLTNSSRYPQKFEWADHMEKDYSSITARDFDALIEKYFKLDETAVIFVEQAR